MLCNCLLEWGLPSIHYDQSNIKMEVSMAEVVATQGIKR